jgi:hypothetical protein
MKRFIYNYEDIHGKISFEMDSYSGCFGVIKRDLALVNTEHYLYLKNKDGSNVAAFNLGTWYNGHLVSVVLLRGGKTLL